MPDEIANPLLKRIPERSPAHRADYVQEIMPTIH
jgi:hypothetical protein